MTGGGAIRRVGLYVLVVNLALAALKGAVWHSTGSLAVGSEAVNSLADSVYSLVIVAGLYLTTQPPDFDHPHGHERIEPFVSLFVALGMFAAGFAIIWRAITNLLAGTVSPPAGVPAVAVLALAAVAKLWLYRYCLSIGREHHSPAVVATAVDNRNDVLTAGAALVGVVGAQLGVPALDPAAAIVVAVGILYSGVGVVRDNVDYLVGSAPPEELRVEIVQRALAHPEVRGAHDVVAHYVGPEIDVSLHVEVEGDRTLLEAHDIETEVMGALRELPQVDDVFVHVDPKEAGEWKDDEEVDRFARPGERESSTPTGTDRNGSSDDGPRSE